MDWQKWLCLWTALLWAVSPAVWAVDEEAATSTDPVAQDTSSAQPPQTAQPPETAQPPQKKEPPASSSEPSETTAATPATTPAPSGPETPAATPAATPAPSGPETPALTAPVKPEPKPVVTTPPVKNNKVVNTKKAKKRLTKKERLALKKAQAEKLTQLQKLADDGEYKKGYELATSMLDSHEGQDKFDFYYGLHALESGRVDEATFAFERLTLLNPQILRYRLELARSLFLNNNLDSAKNEFEMALSSKPPKNVQQNIRLFLKQIKDAQRGAMHRFNGGLDMAFGYDSNINSATEEKGVTFPDLGFVTLQDEARSLGSTFKSLNTSFAYGFSPSKRHSIDANVQTTHKRNDELSNYDLDVINGFVGYSWQPGSVRLQGGANINTVSLDGEDYQSQNGLSGMMLYTTAKKNSYGLNLNIASRESKNENLPDADVLLMGFNASWIKNNIEMNNVSVYSGDESVDDASLEHFGKTVFGASYNNRILKSRRLSRVMQVSLQTSSFQADTPIFNKKRSDTSIMASWGYEWKPWKYVSWHGEASLNHNASNLDLYTYYRAMISTGIRVAF